MYLNASKLDYDKTQVERKSVRLVGRKDMTTPILTVEIADMVRAIWILRLRGMQDSDL